MTQEERKIIHQEYMDRYHILCDLSKDTSKIYHNALMTVNAGAFGLSFTYILQLKDAVMISPLWLIVTSWGCMALSLIITLFSIILTLKLVDNEVSLSTLDFNHDVGEISADDEIKRIKLSKDNPKAIKHNELRDYAQCIITSIGIVLLVIYTGITIYSASNIHTTVTKVVSKSVLSKP